MLEECRPTASTTKATTAELTTPTDHSMFISVSISSITDLSLKLQFRSAMASRTNTMDDEDCVRGTLCPPIATAARRSWARWAADLALSSAGLSASIGAQRPRLAQPLHRQHRHLRRRGGQGHGGRDPSARGLHRRGLPRAVPDRGGLCPLSDPIYDLAGSGADGRAL